MRSRAVIGWTGRLRRHCRHATIDIKKRQIIYPWWNKLVVNFSCRAEKKEKQFRVPLDVTELCPLHSVAARDWLESGRSVLPVFSTSDRCGFGPILMNFIVDFAINK